MSDGGETRRDRSSTSSRACSSEPRYSLALISSPNAEKMVAELEDPIYLITREKLSSLQAMLPILEAVVQSGKAAGFIIGRILRERLWPRSSSTSCAAGLKVRGGQGAGLWRSPQAMLEDIAWLTARQFDRRGPWHQA